MEQPEADPTAEPSASTATPDAEPQPEPSSPERTAAATLLSDRERFLVVRHLGEYADLLQRLDA